VTRVNDALVAAPEMVNKDPYGAGWIVAVALKDAAELDELLSAEAYAAYVAEIEK
jgi:glycine cleavage system H protein